MDTKFIIALVSGDDVVVSEKEAVAIRNIRDNKKYDTANIKVNGFDINIKDIIDIYPIQEEEYQVWLGTLERIEDSLNDRTDDLESVRSIFKKSKTCEHRNVTYHSSLCFDSMNIYRGGLITWQFECNDCNKEITKEEKYSVDAKELLDRC